MTQAPMSDHPSTRPARGRAFALCLALVAAAALGAVLGAVLLAWTHDGLVRSLAMIAIAILTASLVAGLAIRRCGPGRGRRRQGDAVVSFYVP